MWRLRLLPIAWAFCVYTRTKIYQNCMITTIRCMQAIKHFLNQLFITACRSLATKNPATQPHGRGDSRPHQCGQQAWRLLQKLWRGLCHLLFTRYTSENQWLLPQREYHVLCCWCVRLLQLHVCRLEWTWICGVSMYSVYQKRSYVMKVTFCALVPCSKMLLRYTACHTMDKMWLLLYLK